MKMRMKEMKVRWWWKWGESYSTRTRSGERKRRGKEQTPTLTHLARSGLKAKRREKRRPTDTEQDQRRGGKGRKRLNQANKAKTYAYLGTRRTRPTWGKNAWKWESKIELKFTARIQFKSRESCVIPERDRNQIQPYGHKQLFKFQRLRCTKV